MSTEPPQRPLEQTQVAREAKDILLKRLAQSLRGIFVAGLELDLPAIVEVLPAEVPILEVRAEFPDLLFRLADGSILHIEFQTTRSPDNLRRFSNYSFAVSEHYKAEVYTIVIYGPGISEAPSMFPRGSHVFTVRNIYLGLRDGEAVVARLREAVAHGEELSPAEQLDVMLLPLMEQSRPLSDVLAEVASLARTLPQPERDEVIGTMVGLAYNYLEPGMAERLLEVLRMANALEDLLVDTILRGREEGRVEGRVESTREAILGFLAARFGPVPSALQARIEHIDDLERLKSLVHAAGVVASLEEFGRSVD